MPSQCDMARNAFPASFVSFRKSSSALENYTKVSWDNMQGSGISWARRGCLQTRLRSCLEL